MSQTAKKNLVWSSKRLSEGGSGPVNRRILVVEDEKSVASAYSSILSPAYSNVIPMRRSSRMVEATPTNVKPVETFDVKLALSAKEALALVQKSVEKNQPFAGAFVDILLGPGMDGVDLAKELFKLDPRLFIVFVTAYSDRGIDSIHDVLGSDKGGRWDYMAKPFTEGEILQKARNAVAWWNLQREKEDQTEALAEANQILVSNERMASIAAIARSVSHEFGNILVQIIGRAELSKDGNESDLRQAIDTILKATETATAILDRFKRLGNPQDERNFREDFDLQIPVDEAFLLLDHEFTKQGVKVCRVKTEKCKVRANKASLVQVFVNIIINALHAMENMHGQIDITIQNITDFAEVIIRDYGPGIPEENLAKVTEAFFTTKKNKGTGLGLAICKEIVEIEHQGEFIVRNHPMQGAELVVRIPFGDGEGADNSASNAAKVLPFTSSKAEEE